MKKILVLLFAFLLIINFADAQDFPKGMKYQAVARDLSGNVLADQAINLKITLYSAIDRTELVKPIDYVEYHETKTNKLGLFTLTIGAGKVESGTFELIPWSSQEVWMGVAIDATGGTDFVSISESKLLAVPYAIHAFSASELVGVGGEKGPGNGNNGSNGARGNVWKVGGNIFNVPGPWLLGTIEDDDLVMITNNMTRLTIDGVTGKVDIVGDLGVGNDLDVVNNVFLNTNLTGQTINNGDFTVANQSSTLLTGTLNVNLDTDLDAALNVDGITDLNMALNVNNVSPTSLTGTLDVDDNATFHQQVLVDNAALGSSSPTTGALVVDGGVGIGQNLNVGGNLEVLGTSTFEDLNVNNNVHINTNGTGTTIIDGVTTINKATTVNGTMNVNGSGSYIANFVNSSDANGISIQVANGNPSSSNNFVTFRKSNGDAVGRIEGQTSGDLTSNPEYLFETAILGAEIIAAAANIVLSALPNACAGAGAVACPPEPSVVAIAIAEEILAIANEAAYQIFAFANLGVTYESGSADYAEWLERQDPSERIVPGDIVGVVGGKISKNTSKVNQYLVASTNPAVLGNMPPSGQTDRYDKIAFMGQIPVKVRGQANIGDYIIPSGLNDGTGIPISPEHIKPDQYAKIVGIAWTASPEGSFRSFVNMAIGLNTNDVAKLVLEQNNRIEQLESDFTLLESRLLALESGTSIPANQIFSDVSSINQIDDYEMEYETLNADLIEDAIMLLQDSYQAKGIAVNSHAGLKKLFNDQEWRQKIIQQVITNYEQDRANILKMR